MSKPKAPGESAEARRARLNEEERIRIAQARADADEAAAGRQFLTRRTRMVMRLFGSRKALAGMGGAPALGGGTFSGVSGGGGRGALGAGFNAFSGGDGGGGFGLGDRFAD